MCQSGFLCFVMCLSWMAQSTGAQESKVPPRPSNGRGGNPGIFPDESLQVDGANRAYRLVVPETVDLNESVALVFAFHGLVFDGKEQMARYTRLKDLARREGFLLVYPGALQRRWRLDTDKNPDIRFFDLLYDHLVACYNIDLNRVYLVGMSYGAYFIHQLAAQRSEKIAAVAVHSGGLGGRLSGISAKHKYPVMIIHGVRDQIIPIQQSRLVRDKYRQEGHPVQYVEIQNLRHFWASGSNINDRIWAFFRKYPLLSDAD